MLKVDQLLFNLWGDAFFFIEKLKILVKSFINIQVAVYPGNVLALHMSTPQGFKYTSGQYIYVNCSAISPFQW